VSTTTVQSPQSPSFILKLDADTTFDVVSGQIPADRDAALALYKRVKDIEAASYAALPRDKSQTNGDASAYTRAHEAHQDNFANPRKYLWNRIATRHQGNQGHVKVTPSLARWAERNGITL
jgi:hypothetical protein